ncbi:hypothetical protein LZ32DRAFT_37616 [Colletotrichum eremochloae]|nr:hypothetical protein LZ32DRAFT_37616 [Colletotrichum eremochloae]
MLLLQRLFQLFLWLNRAAQQKSWMRCVPSQPSPCTARYFRSPWHLITACHMFSLGFNSLPSPPKTYHFSGQQYIADFLGAKQIVPRAFMSCSLRSRHEQHAHRL